MERKRVLSFRIEESKYKNLVEYVRKNNLRLSSVIRAAVSKYLSDRGVIRCQ